MKCENLRAYMDDELGFVGRLAMIAHLRSCTACRQNVAEWLCLSRETKRLEGEPVPPSLEQKLMADAMTAASARAHANSPALHKPRAMEALRMEKKGLLAAGFAIALLAVALTMFPRPHKAFALANVARAMESVRSVHFSGWHTGNKGRIRFDGWQRGGRYSWSSENQREVADNGTTCTIINNHPFCPYVTIEDSHAARESMQDDYMGLTLVNRYLSDNSGARVESRRDAASDGRPVVVTKISWPDGAAVITTDAKTDLLVRYERYDRGELITLTDRYDYNVPIPKSTFSASIPKGIPVVDMVTPPTEEQIERHKLQEKQLKSVRTFGWVVTHENAGEHAAKYHPRFHFIVVGRQEDETTIVYLPDKNLYRVCGQAILYDRNGSEPARLVRDEDVKLPGTAQCEQVLMRDGRPGACCALQQEDYNRWLFRWVNVGPGALTITYNDCTGRYAVHGTAKLIPLGTVFTDQTMDMRSSQDLLPKVVTAPKLDWTGVQAGEIKRLKAGVEVERRLYHIMRHNDSDGHVVIDGGHFLGFDRRVGPGEVYEPLSGDILEDAGGAIEGTTYSAEYYHRKGFDHNTRLAFELAGSAPYAYCLQIPSKKEVCVVGALRLIPSGKIVKNGLVSYDGRVLSSER